jgi:hypothetical protein
MLRGLFKRRPGGSFASQRVLDHPIGDTRFAQCPAQLLVFGNGQLVEADQHRGGRFAKLRAERIEILLLLLSCLHLFALTPRSHRA